MFWHKNPFIWVNNLSIPFILIYFYLKKYAYLNNKFSCQHFRTLIPHFFSGKSNMKTHIFMNEISYKILPIIKINIIKINHYDVYWINCVLVSKHKSLVPSNVFAAHFIYLEIIKSLVFFAQIQWWILNL